VKACASTLGFQCAVTIGAVVTGDTTAPSASRNVPRQRVKGGNPAAARAAETRASSSGSKGRAKVAPIAMGGLLWGAASQVAPCTTRRVLDGKVHTSDSFFIFFSFLDAMPRAHWACGCTATSFSCSAINGLFCLHTLHRYLIRPWGQTDPPPQLWHRLSRFP
jgi:hypothetical protein